MAKVDGGFDWPEIDFETDPRFVLGWRRGSQLSARRVLVHDSAFGDLRSMCEPAFQSLRFGSGRPYEPHAGLVEGEEYFAIKVDELPLRPAPKRRSKNPDEWDGTAQLVQLLEDVDALTTVAAADLVEQEKYLFYAVCWRIADRQFVSFVRKTNPRQVLHPGTRFMRFDQALKPSERPDLVLDGTIDVVLAPGIVGALNATAFGRLFNDVRVLVADVDRNVADSLKRLKAKRLKVSGDASAALSALGKRRVSVASRLSRLSDRIDAITVTPESLMAVVKRHGIDPASMFDKSGAIHFTDADAALCFLDIVESRYFDDELGGERRRADRYSTRQ